MLSTQESKMPSRERLLSIGRLTLQRTNGARRLTSGVASPGYFINQVTGIFIEERQISSVALAISELLTAYAMIASDEVVDKA